MIEMTPQNNSDGHDWTCSCGHFNSGLDLCGWCDKPRPADSAANEQEREAKMYDLLREAYTRLMVSEGDARYIARNVELAERIAELIDVD